MTLSARTAGTSVRPITVLLSLLGLSACITLAAGPYETVHESPDAVSYRVDGSGSGIAPIGLQVDAAAARHCDKTNRAAVMTERSETPTALYIHYVCRAATD